MNYEKALLEIKKLQDDGLFFKYEFTTNVMNIHMFCIKEEGYSMKDIVSKLKPDEKLIIFINDGNTWNGERGKNFKMLYNEKYDNSIYWEHQQGDCVRVGSDKGSLNDWSNELNKKFSIPNDR